MTREDDAWLGEVPDLKGAHTWTRSLAAVDQGVREVIVLAAGLPDEAMAGLDIDYEYRTGDAVIDTQSVELRNRRRELHELDAEVTTKTERLATELVGPGYSVRDAAVLTGVSYQRVSQLTRQAS